MTRVVLLCLLSAGCRCRSDEITPPRFQPPSDSVLLPIPDRQWEEGAPDEGWCGETSIQMIALHYGAWVPQPVINSLGRSTHVDLWEEDVPTALDKLGLRYERAQVQSREEFISWIIGRLRLGYPVIVGAKLMPTEHPEWDVDHLMPIVGFSQRGLTFDTNMDPGQEEIPYAALGGQQGISFVSPAGKFYGFAVLGFRESGPRVTLKVMAESAESIELELSTRGAGNLRWDDLDGGVSVGPMVKRVTVRRGEAARFSVVP